MINKNFENKHHQMVKKSNNNFKLKQCNKTLHEVKIGKHECNKIDVIFIRFDLQGKHAQFEA